MGDFEQEYNEYLGYKEKIERNQEMAILLESLHLLNSETIKRPTYKGIYGYETNHGYQADIAHYNFNKLFYNSLDELIKNDFIINLHSKIEGLDEWIIKNYESNPNKAKEIVTLYDNMCLSFNLCSGNENDLIYILIKNECYEVLMELIISEKVLVHQKFKILDTIIRKYPEKLEGMFSTIPSMYLPFNDYNERKEELKKIVTKNLKVVFSEYNPTYIGGKVDEKIFEECKDCMSLMTLEHTIKFFINYDLININESRWKKHGKNITNAAMFYEHGKRKLAMYLYDLPEYKNIDSKLRDDSDIEMIEMAVYRRKHEKKELIEFVKQNNYVNTKEKMLLILDLMEKFNKRSSSVCYDEKYIQDVIDILIRKTKKEDYKEVNKALIDREQAKIDSENNKELLSQKRQEIVSTLAQLNNYLFENVPAKQKIKEIEFGSKLNN